MDTLTKLLEGSPIVEGGLMLMLAGWLGYQLRALPERILSVVRARFTRVIEIREQNPLYEAWLSLVTEGAVRTGGPRQLELRALAREHDLQALSSDLVAGTGSFAARVCGKWCWVCIHREESVANGHDLVRRFIITIEVICPSRTDLSRMVATAKLRANVRPDRAFVDICGKYGARTSMSLPRRDPGTLCLPRGYYARLEAKLRDFAASRTDYERAGIPWRLGVLLYGAPGTGKTSLAHTLASQLERRLAVIPLADLQADEELVSAFDAVLDDSIVLIEDVDCAFRQRASAQADGITFSGFLNCIDGMLAPHNGRILIMSTNHVDRLDTALIRPGRIDLRVEVPLLTREAASDYVDRVFAHVPTRHEVVDGVMQEPQPTAALLLNHLLRQDWRLPRGPRSQREAEEIAAVE